MFEQLSNYTCISCTSECAICFESTVNDCNKCNSGSFLIYDTTYCNASCPDGQYSNSTSNMCLLCDSNCITCSSTSSTCLTCGFNSFGIHLFLVNNTCVQDCSGAYYEESGNHTCTACHAGCLTCLDSALNLCSSCRNDSTTQYYKYIGDTICDTTCPLGQFVHADFPNNCQACNVNCIGC